MALYASFANMGTDRSGSSEYGTKPKSMSAIAQSGHWGGGEIRTDCGAAARLFFS